MGVAGTLDLPGSRRVRSVLTGHRPCRRTQGGILTCELAVLDDISRAPGEALNVLLRVLNERRWGKGPKLPLMTAIATGNPVQEDGFYGDPLDPATLDRFTLQLRAQGLVQSGAWEACAEVNHSESNQLAIRSA